MVAWGGYKSIHDGAMGIQEWNGGCFNIAGVKKHTSIMRIGCMEIDADMVTTEHDA